MTPDDVKFLVPFLFPHRLILTMEGAVKKTRAQVVNDILKEVPVPVELEVENQ